MVGVAGSSLKMVKSEPTNTQHVATCHNRVAKRVQHVAPNNVTICRVSMLPSLGRGFTLSKDAGLLHVGNSYCSNSMV